MIEFVCPHPHIQPHSLYLYDNGLTYSLPPSLALFPPLLYPYALPFIPPLHISLHLLSLIHLSLNSLITFDVLFKDVVHYRVNVLIDILEQEGEAIFDGHFQLFQEVGLVEVGYLEVVGLLFLPDPVDGLLLRVDTERESTGVCGQDTVLH